MTAATVESLFGPGSPATLEMFSPLKLDGEQWERWEPKLAVRTGLVLRWSEGLVERLVGIGFDARYGARPMQRAIEREATAPLAKWLLSIEVVAGGIVGADWVNGAWMFRVGSTRARD